MPCPNPTCCIGHARSMSNSSGRSHTRSSRFAEPSRSSTFAPSGMCSPCRSTGRVSVRAISCVEPSYRRISSTASGMRPGSLATLARSLGNRWSASRQLASSFVVVSLPAMIKQEAEPDDLLVGEHLVAGIGGAERGGEIVGCVAVEIVARRSATNAREVLEEVDRGVDPGGRHVGHAFVAVRAARSSTPAATPRLPPEPRACCAITSIGEPRRVVGDEIAVTARQQRFEKSLRQLAHGRLEVGDAAGRERPADHPAQIRVIGRVRGEQHRQRAVLFERDAVARADTSSGSCSAASTSS